MINTIRKYLCVILLIFPTVNYADDLIIVLGSHHMLWHEEQAPNEDNLGLMYRHNSGILVGAYNNSYYKTSYVGGFVHKYNRYISTTIVGASGYDTAIKPLVGATLNVQGVGLSFYMGFLVTMSYIVEF